MLSRAGEKHTRPEWRIKFSDTVAGIGRVNLDKNPGLSEVTMSVRQAIHNCTLYGEINHHK